MSETKRSISFHSTPTTFKMRYFSILYIFFFIACANVVSGQIEEDIGNDRGGDGPFVVNIKVQDTETKEPLIGVNIQILNSSLGDITDVNGEASFNLEQGAYSLKLSYIGYNEVQYIGKVLGKGKLNVKMTQGSATLEEIIISSKASDANVRNTELGKSVLSVETIEGLPPFVGEVDILKSITLLPGVSSVGEASSGFNIRGGSSDQNLILLGGAPLYNPSHLFGFFSAFNSDLLQDAIIYKGGIPANYGGRAASIIDLKLKRGNPNNWEGKGSLGLISAKVSAGGPIIKEKLTLLVAGRTSYSNWILNAINNAEISNSSAQFYDVNAILDYAISDNSNLRYSFYRSADEFNLVSDTAFVWSNQNHVLEYNQGIGDKLILSTSISDVEYKFSIVNDSDIFSFDLDSKVKDQAANLSLKYFVQDDHEMIIGAQTKLVTISPGELIPGENSPVMPKVVASEKAIETGLFFNHNFELGSYIGLSYGLRYNIYNFLGPKRIAQYEEILPRTAENIVGFSEFGKNDVIQQYTAFEPRAALRISFNENTSFKLGYNRMNQFIHLISNTTTIAPTDLWKLSDPFIKPQMVTQYSAGIFKNFANNTYETSIEAYYKDLRNIVDYRDGASLILNDNLETELLSGKGIAYGIELYVKKNSGKLTGWISYTYSVSQRQVIGSYPEEIINQGNWYPANFDKPHNLSTVAEYKFSDKFKMSSIFTYSTGRPVSYPEAKFNYSNQILALYGDRNSNRIPDYHRLDLSMTFSLQNSKAWKAGDLVFSVYNLYGRKNALNVFFDDVVGAPPQAYKLSVLGIPFPSVSYNFKF